jgi:hypothetical protein
MLVAGCGGGGGPTATANSGIDGLALTGPTCPVENVSSPCPPRPIAAPIEVSLAGGSSGQQIQSDSSGRFSIVLPPGEYTVRPLAITNQAFPAPGPAQTVTVVAGQFVQVTVTYDTGIR